MSTLPLDREAVRRYLARAIFATDMNRPPAPITLAGQRPSNGVVRSAPPASPAPPSTIGTQPTHPTHDRPRDRARDEPEPGDGQWSYSREELIRMDNRFRARLLRAFKRGKESHQT
jgi:hypothetical protein